MVGEAIAKRQQLSVGGDGEEGEMGWQCEWRFVVVAG